MPVFHLTAYLWEGGGIKVYKLMEISSGAAVDVVLPSWRAAVLSPSAERDGTRSHLQWYQEKQQVSECSI